MPAFLVPSWYRVAALRPRLLEHVRVERHRYGGQAWYSLHDRLSGRVHRVSPAAYLFAVRMDGKRTVDELWQELVAELDVDAPGQETVLTLLAQLHGADLLAGGVPPDSAELLTRRDRNGRQLLARNLRSPISLQIPVFDPDRMLTRLLPFVRPLLGPFGIVLWLVLVGTGVLTAVRHWPELTDNVLDRLLAAEGLLAFALCYPVIKALHELGHGLVAKRFGCEVREMGVMLLVLFPVPYVDASNSAALRSRWQRAAVAFAGIAVEMALAAAAMLVWVEAEPGLLRALAFDVMTIGGVSTLLVNGNPLLRFDGYYVLSDVLAVPNLAGRSVRYLGYLMNRYVFGVHGLPPFAASAGERAAMLAYAPLSWCYRTLTMVTVALFLAAHYFIVGIAMAAATAVLGVAWPLLKALGRIASAPLYAGRRGRAAGLTFGGLAALAALVLWVPVPVHTAAQGVVWLPESAMVRAGADGFVTAVTVADGATVTPGAGLFTLRHDIAEARMAVTAAQVEELRAKVQAEWVTDRIAAAVSAFELAQDEVVLTRERDRMAHMTVIANATGVFTPARALGDTVGRYVKEGEVLGWVTPAGGLVARVLVPQEDMDLVSNHLRQVRLRLADGQTELASGIVRAVPAAAENIPHPALASSNGGAITADVRDTKVLKAFSRHFQFDVALPAGTDVAAQFGSRVSVRFDYAWEPMGDMLYRRVRQMLLTRFEA